LQLSWREQFTFFILQLSWREQFTFFWDGDDVCSRATRWAAFYSVSLACWNNNPQLAVSLHWNTSSWFRVLSERRTRTYHLFDTTANRTCHLPHLSSAR
jgi:hypothetical protein